MLGRHNSNVAITCLVALCITSCGSPDKSWDLAEREDTPQGYLEFLAKYPDGEFAERARQRIAELDELRAWERAQFRDRIENYQRFIENFPDSNFGAPAKARAAQLVRDAAWAEAESAGTVDSLNAFLSDYPDAPQREQAEQRIAALTPPAPEPPPERDGAFRLQVGAFRTAAAAAAEVRRLDPRFGELLYGPIRIDSAAEGSSRPFVLKTVPMSGPEARDACSRLKALDQDCFIINR